MASGPRLVHKQFNSPIGLYSQQNIQETLSRHAQQLQNGAVGIDFSDPVTSKPTNLANSSVLRLLEEEEERQRRGNQPRRNSGQVRAIKANTKRIEQRFDWPPRGEDPQLFTWERKGLKKVVWPPEQEVNGHYHQPQSGDYHQPQYDNYSGSQSQGPLSPIAQPYRPEPPPTTIMLRQSVPVHQRPLPVFPSQPATASFQGGVNMRGDQKWPPQTVKDAVEAENEARRFLAKGPACRPRRVKKDYTQFFAENALNQQYPAYRAPPGTQHYEDHSGQTQF